MKGNPPRALGRSPATSFGSRRRRWTAGMAAVLLLGAAWLGRFTMESETEAPAAEAPADRGNPAALWTWGIAAPAGEPSAKPDTGIEAGMRLFSSGSLAGTEAAGNWCVVEEERLEPCRGLRDRFDYYLLGLGEVDLESLGKLVEGEAARAHGPVLAARITEIWRRYLEATAYAPRTILDLTEPDSWMALQAELHGARQRILGPDWASAFFQEEEQALREVHGRLAAGTSPPAEPGGPVPQLAPGMDPAAVYAERAARYGEAAAQRLARLDEDWTDWEQRLTAARGHWAALQQSTQLSDLQRRQDMDRYVAEHFSPGEHRRIRALLRL